MATETIQGKESDLFVILELDFTADGSGVFTAHPISADLMRYLRARYYFFYQMDFYIGGTAPNALDVTVTDSLGRDLLNAEGAALTVTGPGYINTRTPQMVYAPLTINLTGNTTASATMKLKLQFGR